MTKLQQPETKVEPQPVTVERISTPFDEAFEMANHMFEVIAQEIEDMSRNDIASMLKTKGIDLSILDRAIREIGMARAIWCQSIGTERFTKE